MKVRGLALAQQNGWRKIAIALKKPCSSTHWCKKAVTYRRCIKTYGVILNITPQPRPPRIVVP
jgi:hypothetical protein